MIAPARVQMQEGGSQMPLAASGMHAVLNRSHMDVKTREEGQQGSDFYFLVLPK